MLSEWVVEISIAIAIPLVAYFSNWLRIRTRYIKTNRTISEQNAEEIKLIKKTLLMIMRRVDKQTAKAHGEDEELYCLAKEMLTDSVLNGHGRQAI